MSRNRFVPLCLLLVLTAGCGRDQEGDSMESRYVAELGRHYESIWGPASETARWTRGPVGALPEYFGVAVFPPSSERRYWVHATTGMSLGLEEEGLELHLFSPTRSDENVELLTVVAHYHRTGARLGLNHSVDFGRPWLAGSTCDHGLISLPYLHGPKLEWATISGLRVRNLWLIPITKAEREYKRQHGTEALEQLFEKGGLNYLDPYRRSFVAEQSGT